jgi:hypothetical protein
MTIASIIYLLIIRNKHTAWYIFMRLSLPYNIREDEKAVWDLRAKTNVKYTRLKSNIMVADMSMD